MSLANTLKSLLGPGAVLTAAEDLTPYVEDWRGRYRGLACCVVLPSTTAAGRCGRARLRRGARARGRRKAATPACAKARSRARRRARAVVINLAAHAPHPRGRRRQQLHGRRRRLRARGVQAGGRGAGPALSREPRRRRLVPDRRQHRHQRRRHRRAALRQHARERARPRGRAARRPYLGRPVSACARTTPASTSSTCSSAREGTLGIITAATLKLHPLPDRARRWRGWRSPRPQAALAMLGRFQQRCGGALSAYEMMNDVAARHRARPRAGPARAGDAPRIRGTCSSSSPTPATRRR